MKKWFVSLIAVLLALPLFNNVVFAEDMEDESVYNINFVTESRATNGNFDNPVTLIYENDKKYIQMSGTSGNYIESLKVNDKEVTWGVREVDGEFVVQFEHTGELTEELKLSMVINTGQRKMSHDNIMISFDETTKKPADSQEYTIYTESLPYPNEKNVYNVNFVTESRATNGNFDNPVTLIYENDKKYIQMSGTSGNYIESLKVNDKEVTWGVREVDGEFVVQFEHTGELTEELKLSMVINTGQWKMSHDNIMISFDETTKKPADSQEYTIYTESLPYPNEKNVYNVNFVTESRATNGNFDNPVTLIYENDKKYIQMSGTSGNYIESLKVNDKEVTWGVREVDGEFVVQFEHTGELTEELKLSMVINTGQWKMSHDNIMISFDESTKELANSQEYTIYTESLPYPNIKDEDKEEKTPPKENSNETENPKEITYAMNFVIKHNEKDEISVASNYFNSPITIIEKNGKRYVELTSNSPEFIQSLKAVINGENYKFSLVNDKNGVFRAEIPMDFDLTNVIPLHMHIDVPGVYSASHETRLVLTPVSQVIKPGERVAVNAGEEIFVDGGNVNTIISLPTDLPEGVKITVKKVTPKSIKGLEVAGNVIDFSFEGLDNYDGIVIKMDYDISKYSGDQVDIYYFDENTQKWVAQDGTVENGTIILEPGHFSVYGVFATVEVDDSEQKSKEEGNKESKVDSSNVNKADKAHKVNFVIYDETGKKVSAANQFFEKPAVLLEKDGVYYVQITTNANQFIDSLSNRYGEFLYVGKDEDGNHVYQFRLDGDLTDEQIIEMVISVPGIYDGEKYTTRLVLDSENMEEINSEVYELVAGNANGPTDGPQPVKPKLGDSENSSTEKDEGVSQNTAGLNPKTGENTNIMLYMLLLIASAIPLAIKARRHFA